MKAKMLLALFLCIVLASPAYALRAMSADRVIIDSPINDDVFVSGGEIAINAPVASATIFAGNISVNAPIAGDLFAAGGAINVNSDVGGKIVAAGGIIRLNGSASNAALAGARVIIEKSAIIHKDAIISGDNVLNSGKIIGNLTVSAQAFENTGSAGNTVFKKTGGMEGFRKAIGGVRLLGFFGFLIAGIVLLKLFPRQFQDVDAELRVQSAKKTAVGFILMIFSAAAILFLAITIIGIPLALIALMGYVTALLLSPLFVSFSIGKALSGRPPKAGDIWLFAAGFILLNIAMLIPVIGAFISIIAVSLGFGAMYYALRNRASPGQFSRQQHQKYRSSRLSPISFFLLFLPAFQAFLFSALR